MAVVNLLIRHIDRNQHSLAPVCVCVFRRKKQCGGSCLFLRKRGRGTPSQHCSFITLTETRTPLLLCVCVCVRRKKQCGGWCPPIRKRARGTTSEQRNPQQERAVSLEHMPSCAHMRSGISQNERSWAARPCARKHRDTYVGLAAGRLWAVPSSGTVRFSSNSLAGRLTAAMVARFRSRHTRRCAAGPHMRTSVPQGNLPALAILGFWVGVLRADARK